MKDQTKNTTHATNSFCLITDESPTDTMEKKSSLDDVCGRCIQIYENNSKRRTTSYRKSKEMSRKNKFSVTVILGDSIVKEVKS